jgi:hypothetical protein
MVVCWVQKLVDWKVVQKVYEMALRWVELMARCWVTMMVGWMVESMAEKMAFQSVLWWAAVMAA